MCVRPYIDEVINVSGDDNRRTPINPNAVRKSTPTDRDHYVLLPVFNMTIILHRMANVP